MVVRKGNPEGYELEKLANGIYAGVWKRVARKLMIKDPRIAEIDEQEKEIHEKMYRVLQDWKQENGSAATWEKLYQTLMDANLRELAEKHCCVKMN